jgi:phage N-6-adenine-methyltransferase
MNTSSGGLWQHSTGAVGFKSASGEWDTPQAFYDKLNQGFGFSLDPCATAPNAKCKKYFTEVQNGLAQDWGGHRVFVNPPYGRKIGDWLKKGFEESTKPDTTVVMLVPARTDTKWWHNYVMKAKEVHLVRGRLTFGSSTSPAPFPSAVVIFHTATFYTGPVTPLPVFYPMERT